MFMADLLSRTPSTKAALIGRRLREQIEPFRAEQSTAPPRPWGWNWQGPRAGPHVQQAALSEQSRVLKVGPATAKSTRAKEQAHHLPFAFGRSTRSSRNSGGPLVRRRLRWARSSAGTAGSSFLSIVCVAISEARAACLPTLGFSPRSFARMYSIAS